MTRADRFFLPCSLTNALLAVRYRVALSNGEPFQKCNMKVFPQLGETSLANALRFALRPGEFKMTSIGQWHLVASLAESVDILWVSNSF